MHRTALSIALLCCVGAPLAAVEGDPAPPADEPPPAPAAGADDRPYVDRPDRRAHWDEPRGRERGRRGPVWLSNLYLSVGQKFLDDDDWGDIDRQGAIGFHYDGRLAWWPIGFATGIVGSSGVEEENDVETSGGTIEAYAGVQGYWGGPMFRGYAGLGLVAIGAGIEIEDQGAGTDVDDEDSGGGLYAQAGFQGDIREHFFVGGQLRVSGADVDLFGEEVQAGGLTFAFTIGGYW